MQTANSIERTANNTERHATRPTNRNRTLRPVVRVIHGFAVHGFAVHGFAVHASAVHASAVHASVINITFASEI